MLVIIIIPCFWDEALPGRNFHVVKVFTIFLSSPMQLKLKCKLDSTNGGTFSNSAEQVILIFFLFQRALVMSKLVREYKILTTYHPEMSNGQFHCFHYGTPPKGTKTTQTQTLKRLVKINFFKK